MLDGQNVYWVDRERLGVDDVREGWIERGERRLSRDEGRVDEGSPVHGDGVHGAPGIGLLHHHARERRPPALVDEELRWVCGRGGEAGVKRWTGTEARSVM